MVSRCVSCGVIEGLLNCTNDDCPHLLCRDHSLSYGGRCKGCWESGSILLPPRPFGTPSSPADYDGCLN